MELTVTPMAEPPVSEAAVEVVERKGLGHPDTICDALAERFSVALSRFYLDHCGQILHHNVDKVLLWGGVSRPAFGGGAVVEPIELFLAGRATASYEGVTVPVADLATEACRNWLSDNFHALDAERHVKVHCLVRPGAPELVDLFMRESERGAWRANDTSCGVGYAPLSALEETVLAVEKHLNAPKTKSAHPAIGEDVKVMGVRTGEQFSLTVGCAMIGRHLRDLEQYREAKEVAAALACDAARRVGDRPVTVVVNAADDPDSGNVYLTVTGTSAESGDDGQAGRGNRDNGLITPYRPMTMESVAGKNPITHVGKLYNVVATSMAVALVQQVPEVSEARCMLVSQIGRLVTDPRLVEVRLRPAAGVSVDDLTARVGDIVHREIQNMSTLWRKMISGAVTLY